MECETAQSSIDGYLDRELDPARSLEIEDHLRACDICSQTYKDHQNLRDAFRSDAVYFKAPADLHKRVQRAVRQVSKAESAPKWRAWSWIRFAAPLAAAALVMVTLLPYDSGRSREEFLAQEVIAGHIRSLMVDHLADVASSDRHTVKPWFNGKLDFSPPVEDFAAEGFPLTGGRLDYIDNRPIAALVYQRHKHLINLFLWPAGQTKAVPVTYSASKGYNLLHWTNTGLNFWLVSDLEREQLEKFVELLKNQTRAP